MSKLTDITIAKLPLAGADENQYTRWDDLPSFGIQVGRRSKTFVLKNNNKYHTLGRWPSVSLKMARDEAKRRLALKYFPKTTPSKVALEEYFAHQEARLRPGSFIQFKHHLNRHFPNTNDAIAALTLPFVHDSLRDLSPSQANHAFAIIRAFLNWCVGRQYLDKNPLDRAKLPHKTASRDRVLSDDEIATILRAANGSQFDNILIFLIFSGQRRTQASLTKKHYVDYRDMTITWPKEDMKSNQQHTLPLTPRLQALIEAAPEPLVFGPTPFQAWSRGKKDFDTRVNLPHWTIHDLRRTARTNLARLGTPSISPNKSSLTRRLS